MLNRRDFVKFLALTAAGAAALPEQVAAFQAYYNANIPETDEPLVAVDEIWLCGTADHSTRVYATFFPETNAAKPLAINAFGGVLRWVAAPDQKVVLRRQDVRWNITTDREEVSLNSILKGHISFIDQNRIRRNWELKEWEGSLDYRREL